MSLLWCFEAQKVGGAEGGGRLEARSGISLFGASLEPFLPCFSEAFQSLIIGFSLQSFISRNWRILRPFLGGIGMSADGREIFS